MSSPSKRRVVLRADAGSSIGYGHFVRTVALAAYLRHDFHCEVATFNPDALTATPYQLEEIRKAGAEYLHVDASGRDDYDARFPEALRPGDIVVLDNYYFAEPYQRLVRDRGVSLVCIDDMHRHHFAADLVMTFCPLSRSDFSLEPYTLFRGGLEWSFLREPFLAPRVPQEERRRRGLRRVVMAMGGADPLHLTDRILPPLLDADPEINVSVVAGDTVQVGPAAADPRVEVRRRLSAEEMADLFDSSDLGIFPASTVCMEAISRGLPVAAGHFVDNQEELYAYGVAHDIFSPLGCLRDPDASLAPRIRETLRQARQGKLPEPPLFDFPARRRDIVSLFKNLRQ